MRPYRGRLALMALIAATEIALGVLAPWPLKLVIDNVLGTQPMPPTIAAIGHVLTGDSKAELLFVVVLGGLLLQLGSQVVSTINTQVQVDTGQRMVYTLRARLLAHLQALALRHHISTRTADSVYRLEADAYCVHDLVMSGVFPLVTSVATLTVMFVILLRLDSSLALLSLAVIPFLYACLRYYSKRMIDRAERVKELESKLVERLYEILSSIKVVKGFAREPHELQSFKSAGHETMSARLRFTWQESLFTLVVTAITLTGTALVLAIGGLHVLRGELSIGHLLVVTAYLAAVYGPLSSIAHTTGSLQNAIASARRVREIFSHTPEILDSPNAVDATGIKGDIRFENVGFAYTDDRQILREISFSASPGEMVALVGLTGAGKSTLASLIPRFFEPTSGRVLIDGVDLSMYRLGARGGRLAPGLPEPHFFGGPRGAKNSQRPPAPTDQ
jgi:ATP-binding cassette subfamily B protein